MLWSTIEMEWRLCLIPKLTEISPQVHSAERNRDWTKSNSRPQGAMRPHVSRTLCPGDPCLARASRRLSISPRTASVKRSARDPQHHHHRHFDALFTALGTWRSMPRVPGAI
eukprot:TCALIF_01424-PA protein Name:"Protein of unknown function" AED:0.04 eAED:0.04 QI:263/0.85/0.87/1/0.42/0.37/8/1017/111